MTKWSKYLIKPRPLTLLRTKEEAASHFDESGEFIVHPWSVAQETQDSFDYNRARFLSN